MNENDTQEFEQQVTSTDDHVGGEAELSAADRVKFGMQKRIDVLTASKHEQAAKIEMLMQQVALLAERNNAPVQQQAEDPYAELDPALAKALKFQQATFEKRFEEHQRKLDASVMASQMQQAGQQANLPPEVVARAQAVLTGSRERGVPLTPQDAMNWAIGEAVQAGKWKLPNQAPPRASNGQFAPVNQVYAGAPAPPSSASGVKPLPANFDSLDADEQLRLLEARGVGDSFL